MLSILHSPYTPIGQVAQLVERGPEKAGVGGSIPSLATIFHFLFQHCRLAGGLVPSQGAEQVPRLNKRGVG
jgi:hypothetical protein